MIRAVLLALALIASPAVAQVVTAPPSTGQAIDQAARDAAAAAQAKADAAATPASVTSAVNAATSGVVKTINGTAPNASGAATIAIPTAATSAPPAVTDAGALGTQTTVFALANHTHASKARRIIATTAADGSYTFNYSAMPFSSAPVCAAVAEVASGVTDVVNVQIVGTPTTTSASFLVNRANRSVAALLSLTILSIPAQPGATKIHAICIEP